jgi:hypothetical protein
MPGDHSVGTSPRVAFLGMGADWSGCGLYMAARRRGSRSAKSCQASARFPTEPFDCPDSTYPKNGLRRRYPYSEY